VNKPTLIDLNEVKIKKISCAEIHSLFLSSDGDIYVCGSNRFGDL
jgi:alpha-tubulin suppressor-like RCC1 family protein